MAKTSSSTKKAAKLANQGPSRSVRFQGGTVFPLAIAITLVLGLALIVYARQSVPAADDSPPRANDDHWHAAYGFYLCDQWFELAGALEEVDASGRLVNTNYLRSTVHSHDDGVIHWHPYTSVAVGKRAKLEVFLDTYEVELSDDKIVFPDNQIPFGQQEWIEGETQCNGEDAEVSVVVWDYISDLPQDGKRYISNMGDIRITHDGMAFAIMFAPESVGKIKPTNYDRLQELGAIDGGVNAADPSLFEPVTSSPDLVLDGSGTQPVTSDPDTSEPDTSEPVTSVPVTSTAD